MYILGIETTGAFASVVLMQDDKVLGYAAGTDRFSHLQNLMPQIDAVVKESKLSLGDLDAIAVSCGPGSFTGIRIGVSSARALSQILDIPCVAVSSLEALAMRADSQDGAQAEVQNVLDDESEFSAYGDVLICPMLDARRSQVYAGGYVMENGYPKEVIKAGPYMLDEFMSKTEKYNRILVLGDAIDKYSEKIEDLRGNAQSADENSTAETRAGVQMAPESIRYQDAATVAMLGAKLFAEGGGVSYDKLEPDYMRIPEAERNLKEKQKG